MIFCTAKTGVGVSSATSPCQTYIERDDQVLRHFAHRRANAFLNLART